MTTVSAEKRIHPADWAGQIQNTQWDIYEAVLDAAMAARIPFALGGAFGLAAYIGKWRNTKDLDLYILPGHRERMVALLTELGLHDYYDEAPYDRAWIYRAVTAGTILDVIWAMANQRTRVDEWWMTGPEVEIRGRTVKVAPAEAILWDKLYIMQRQRCDWPDILNLLYEQNVDLDWLEIVKRLDDDIPLLTGALSVFQWLSPGVAVRLPEWLWDRVHLPAPPLSTPRGGRLPEVDRARAALLDTRQWYAREEKPAC
jgi:hypothetical protein